MGEALITRRGGGGGLSVSDLACGDPTWYNITSVTTSYTTLASGSSATKEWYFNNHSTLTEEPLWVFIWIQGWWDSERNGCIAAVLTPNKPITVQCEGDNFQCEWQLELKQNSNGYWRVFTTITNNTSETQRYASCGYIERYTIAYN